MVAGVQSCEWVLVQRQLWKSFGCLNIGAQW